MDVKERELKIWHDLLEHEARRECAIEHWAGELAGHAMALGRLGIIDEEELREMLELADAAYSHVAEELLTREWLQVKAAKIRKRGRVKIGGRRRGFGVAKTPRGAGGCG